MADQADNDTLAHHLEHLAISADDLTSLLTRHHEEGEIHPAPLARSEHLATSLRAVIHALRHHEHLAMSGDDVWKALTIQHKEHDAGEPLT